MSQVGDVVSSESEDSPRNAPAEAVVARARWAIVGVFFVNGLLVSTYLVRIPSLKSSLGLTEGQLGVILTCWGVMAILAMQFVGRLVARFGSAWIIRVALAALPFALYGIGLAGNPWMAGVTVAIGGALVGTIDVAMNAHAVAVERLRGRPILNGCHAAWSISAIVASLLGAAVIRAGVSMAEHTLAVGAVLLLACLVLTRWLLPSSVDRSDPAASTSTTTPGRRGGWTRRVLIFGLIGLALMLCEAAVISWSGVFLHETRGATLAMAAFGFGAFSLFQALGRLVGDPLTERFGRISTFRAHALVAVAGLVIVLVGNTTILTLIGFAVVGYGSSVLVPAIFSAAGEAGGQGPGAATFVARVTTFTYAGILIGPALVGWAGQAIGLAWTFAGLIPLLLATALAAAVTRTQPRTT